MDTSKKDLYWTIAVAAVILLAVVTFWLGGKGNEIVSYISFASVLVSIVLALVAIFYSFVQNVNSQQNIGEMKTLVSEASRIMTEKAGTLAERAMSMEKSVAQLLESPMTPNRPAIPLANQTFCFDASNSQDVLLLAFYCFAKCHELKKPVNPTSFATLLLVPGEELQVSDRQIRQMYYWGSGVVNCLRCFWGPESIVASGEQTQQLEIRNLPSGLRENISSVINSRIQDSRCKPSEKSRLESGMKRIDAYVEAA